MKTYVLTLSKYFLSSHPRAGEPTMFADAFNARQRAWQSKPQNRAQCKMEYPPNTKIKIHTIRANFELWERRIAEVQDGVAILSIRQWSGKPYRSKQIEIARLTAKDGVGIQKLWFYHPYDLKSTHVSHNHIPYQMLAENDGLTTEDWLKWFGYSPLSIAPLQPMAIIHFTPFRY